jgi:hypothetical protein
MIYLSNLCFCNPDWRLMPPDSTIIRTCMLPILLVGTLCNCLPAAWLCLAAIPVVATNKQQNKEKDETLF